MGNDFIVSIQFKQGWAQYLILHSTMHSLLAELYDLCVQSYRSGQDNVRRIYDGYADLAASRSVEWCGVCVCVCVCARVRVCVCVCVCVCAVPVYVFSPFICLFVVFFDDLTFFGFLLYFI